MMSPKELIFMIRMFLYFFGMMDILGFGYAAPYLGRFGGSE